MREQLEELVWAEVSSKLFITRAQFNESIKKWTLKPINGPSGDLRYVWMQHCGEVHFILAGDAKINPRAWLELAEECIRNYGRIIGKVSKDNEPAIKFVERIGGLRVGEDEYDAHYQIKGIPHARHFHPAA